MQQIIYILEAFLGDCRRHDEDKGQASFDCPACSEDKNLSEGDGKGNLELNYYKDVFKCWVCKDTNDMHGSVTKLIKRYGTLKLLAEYRLLQPEKTFEGKAVIKLLELPEGFKLLKNGNSRDFKFNRAMFYLNERGIDSKIIEKYGIGYTTIGQFHNRIIIPSYNDDGVLNYFIARWFDKQYTKLKYLNPDASKQDIIFNENRINWDATIYLVEGAFDHIVVPNSIPLLGKNISDVLLYKLYEKAQSNIVVLLDNDAYDDAEHLYYKLNFGDLENRIRICMLPEGYDPSLIFQKWGRDGIVHYLKNTKKLKERMFF